MKFFKRKKKVEADSSVDLQEKEVAQPTPEEPCKESAPAETAELREIEADSAPSAAGQAAAEASELATGSIAPVAESLPSPVAGSESSATTTADEAAPQREPAPVSGDDEVVREVPAADAETPSSAEATEPVPLPQDKRCGREPHRRAGMARVRFLNSVHRERANRIDAKKIEIGIGHQDHSRSGESSFAV